VRLHIQEMVESASWAKGCASVRFLPVWLLLAPVSASSTSCSKRCITGSWVSPPGGHGAAVVGILSLRPFFPFFCFFQFWPLPRSSLPLSSQPAVGAPSKKIPSTPSRGPSGKGGVVRVRSVGEGKRGALTRPRQGHLSSLGPLGALGPLARLLLGGGEGGTHRGDGRTVPLPFPFTFHRFFAIQGCLGVAVIVFLAVELTVVFGHVRSCWSSHPTRVFPRALVHPSPAAPPPCAKASPLLGITTSLFASCVSSLVPLLHRRLWSCLWVPSTPCPCEPLLDIPCCVPLAPASLPQPPYHLALEGLVLALQVMRHCVNVSAAWEGHLSSPRVALVTSCLLWTLFLTLLTRSCLRHTPLVLVPLLMYGFRMYTPCPGDTAAYVRGFEPHVA
jgi:hypothetical protein